MSTRTATVKPEDVTRTVGDTSERALAYLASPDPALARLPRKVRESLIADLPPVTAGALLGPAALARHFIASAASGRYRDLFPLWELFRQYPDECRPVLADRPQALSKAQDALRTAVVLGLRGRAERVAEDVARAEGLIWQWLRGILVEHLPAVGARPAVAAALLAREPDLAVPLPDAPEERWLAEAADARRHAGLPPQLDRLLAAGVDRLPATVATLALAHESYPERVDALVARIDLDTPDIGAILAWARDHGKSAQINQRIQARVDEAAARDRQEALALWRQWRERRVPVDLPESVKSGSLEGLDLTRPETADLLALLVADGAEFEPQTALDDLAATNRQLAEKAYEAFVCAGLPVRLPKALEGNPIVKEGTRCPYCLAWTWVRPGHEARCPRATAEGTAAQKPEPVPTAADEWTAHEAAATAAAGAAAEAPAEAAPPAEPEAAAPEQAEQADQTDQAEQVRPAEPDAQATDPTPADPERSA